VLTYVHGVLCCCCCCCPPAGPAAAVLAPQRVQPPSLLEEWGMGFEFGAAAAVWSRAVVCMLTCVLAWWDPMCVQLAQFV
jgi:hypothetical protein